MAVSRRGFLRVALLGAAGAATVAVCPDFLADAVLHKSYFFMKSRQPGITTLSLEDMNAITLKYVHPFLYDIVYGRSPLLFERKALRMYFDAGKRLTYKDLIA